MKFEAPSSEPENSAARRAVGPRRSASDSQGALEIRRRGAPPPPLAGPLSDGPESGSSCMARRASQYYLTRRSNRLNSCSKLEREENGMKSFADRVVRLFVPVLTGGITFAVSTAAHVQEEAITATVIGENIQKRRLQGNDPEAGDHSTISRAMLATTLTGQWVSGCKATRVESPKRWKLSAPETKDRRRLT